MTRALTLLALTAALTACSGEESKAPIAKPTVKASEAPPPRVIPPPSAAHDPKVVLQAWAEAMSVKDWEAAYLYWEARGAGTGMNLDQFKAHWGRLTNPQFEIHPGVGESAVSSLYYTAPVVLIDGSRRIEGEVVLRRVSGEAGAGKDDLRWHLASHTLEF